MNNDSHLITDEKTQTFSPSVENGETMLDFNLSNRALFHSRATSQIPSPPRGNIFRLEKKQLPFDESHLANKSFRDYSVSWVNALEEFYHKQTNRYMDLEFSEKILTYFRPDGVIHGMKFIFPQQDVKSMVQSFAMCNIPTITEGLFKMELIPAKISKGYTVYLSIMRPQTSRLKKVLVSPSLSHEDVFLRYLENRLKRFFENSAISPMFEISVPLPRLCRSPGIPEQLNRYLPDDPQIFNWVSEGLKESLPIFNIQEGIDSLGETVLEGMKQNLGQGGADLATALKLAIGCYAVAETLFGIIHDHEYQRDRGLKIITALGLFETAMHFANKPQAGGDPIEQADELLHSTLFGVFTNFTDKFKSISFPEFKSWSNTVIIFDRLTKTIPELTLKILGWFDDFLEWAFGYRLFESLFPGSMGLGAQFTKLLSESREYIDDHRTGSRVTDMNSFETVSNLIKRIDACILGSDKTHPKHALLMSIRRELDDCKKTVLSCIPGLETLRPEPATVLFIGAPGSYKTNIMNRLVTDIKETMRVECRMEFPPAVYAMNPGAKHVDGYSTGTDIITWDEYGQKRDMVGTEENEYTLFIRMVNTGPCPLPMADLSSKGTTFCQAKVICGTTNCTSWKIESITDPGAVDRRWQHQYVVCPKAEFAADTLETKGDQVTAIQRKVDWNKVAIHQGIAEGESCRPLHEEMEYYEWVVGEGGRRHLGCKVTYEEILARSLKNKKVKGEIYRATILQNKLERRKHYPENYGSFDVTMKRLSEECIRENSESEEDEEIDSDLSDSLDEFKDLSLRESFSVLTLDRKLNVAESSEKNIIVNKILDFVRLPNLGFENPKILHKFLDRIGDEVINLQTKAQTRIKGAFGKLLGHINDMEAHFRLNHGDSALLAVKATVGTLISLGGALVLGMKMYKMFVPPLKEEESQIPSPPQFPQYAKPVEPNKLRPLRDIILGGKNGAALSTQNPQMGHVQDPNGWNIVKSVATSNQYTLYRESVDTKGKKQWVKDGYFLGIMGNVGLIPAHFVLRYEEVRLTKPDTMLLFTQKRGNVDFAQYLQVSDLLDGIISRRPTANENVEDFILVKVPASWGHFRNILNKFRSRSYYQKNHQPNINYSGLVVCDTELRSTDGSKELKQTLFQTTGSAKFVDKFSVTFEGGPRFVGPGYRYDFKTTAGTCGALLIDFNPRVQQEKIVGIHVSGNVLGFGHTMQICQEDITESLKGVEYSKLSDPDIPDEIQIGEALLENVFTPIQKVQAAKSNPKSTLVKTFEPFHELLQPCKLFPADVRNVDLVDTLQEHNLAYVPTVNLVEFGNSVDAFSSYLQSVSDVEVPMKIWDFEEVVFGLGVCASPKLTRGTSPGYPGVLTRKSKGKYDWLGDEVNPRTDLPKFQELIKDVEELKRKILSGERPISPFMLNKKDELRKPGKKARIFGAGSFPNLVLTMQYFGSFVTWYQANRIKNGSSLGVNVYSSEWNAIANRIRRDIVLSGDFKNFDNKRNGDLVYKCLQVFEDYYTNSTQQDREIRAALFLNCVCPYYVYEEHIYSASNGLPSGEFLTATLNTIFNSVVILHCTYLIFNRAITQVNCLSFYSFITNGDDGLVGVTNEVSDFVNEETISIQCEKLGMTYTSDKKDGKFYKRTLEEVSYLKRSFRYEPIYALVIAPFSLDRLFEFLNWTRKIDGEQILKTNVEKFLVELSAHGKEVFLKYSEPVIEAYVSVWGVKPLICKWNMCLDMYMATEVEPYNFQNGDSTQTMNSTTDQPPLQAFLTQAYMYESNSDDSELSSVPNQAKFEPDTFQMGDVALPDMHLVNSTDPIVYTVPFRNDTSFVADAKAGDQEANLSRWLDRPRIMSSGNFTFTDSPTTFPKLCWDDLLKSAPMLKKFEGNFSMQADLELTLTLNGNIQQQGLLALCWLPTGGANAMSAMESNWLHLHAHSKQQILQLPHVKVDINLDTQATLKIPWQSVQNSYHYDSGSASYCPGVFFIYPLIPLNSVSGSTICSYTLYGRYTNVTLAAVSVPQMGGGKKKDLLTQEEEQGSRFVSKTLAIGGDISRALSNVPLLSSFFGPLTWIVDAAAGAAYAWGFSKPTSIEPPSKIIRSLYPGMANCDTTEVSESLALTTANHVTIEQGNCGNIDELGLSGIAQRYGYFATWDWTTSYASGHELAAFYVNLGEMYQGTADSGVTLRNYAPLGWVSTFFSHWRGDIVMRFHFVKTKFHSGRLLVYYEPLVQEKTGAAAGTLDNSFFTMRTIYDITSESICELTIPYAQLSPWQLTQRNCGAVHVVVLDELVAPATVSSTINVFVEVKGADNIEFNAVGNQVLGLSPVVPDTFQMNDESNSQQDTTVSTFGKSTLMEVCHVTHGQKVTSFRQLIKRANYLVANSFTSSATSPLAFYPFSSFIYHGNGTTLEGTSTTITRDLYTTLSTVFLYSRGGVRIRYLIMSPSSFQSYTTRLDFNSASTYPTYFQTLAISLNRWVYECAGLAVGYSTAVSPVSSYLIPQHTVGLSRNNALNVFTAVTALDLRNPFADRARLVIRQDGASPPPAHIMREGADDCNFTCFVSIPPMYVDTVA